MFRFFTISQKAFIRNGNKILVINDPEEGLDFPGGKIEEKDHQDPIAALKREVKEETSLEIEVKRPFATRIRSFPRGHSSEGVTAFLVAYECRYINGEVKLSSEHSHYRWVNKSNYKEVNDSTQFFEILDKYFTQIHK